MLSYEAFAHHPLTQQLGSDRQARWFRNRVAITEGKVGHAAALIGLRETETQICKSFPGLADEEKALAYQAYVNNVVNAQLDATQALSVLPGDVL